MSTPCHRLEHQQGSLRLRSEAGVTEAVVADSVYPPEASPVLSFFLWFLGGVSESVRAILGNSVPLPPFRDSAGLQIGDQKCPS